MVFWITAAALAAAAMAALAVSFFRAAGPAGSDSAFDLEVYADQLKELDRDVERGVLSPEDAEQAGAEISRRILRAKAEMDSGHPTRRTTGMLVIATSVASVPVMAISAYLLLGRPDLPSLPLSARLAAPLENASITELVTRAEKHLSDNPDDGHGWDVLAPIYMRVERFDDAVLAFRAAIRLNGPSPARLNGLGEALTIGAGGRVTVEAQAAFRQSADLAPDQYVARFYLAMARGQGGDKEGAAEDFRRMLAEAPPDAPWRGILETTLQRLEGDGAAPASDAPGPDAAEMAAAAEMEPQDRQAMIETMVAGLAERLAENPDDPAGWRRLIRSYVVLGRLPDAADAVSRALVALGDDPAAHQEISDFARSMNIETGAGQ